MVSSLRYFLIVLLVLLQMAAPWVHAHVGGAWKGEGLHLHELEDLQRGCQSADFSAIEHNVSAHQGLAVDIGAAIEEQRFDQQLPDLAWIESVGWLAFSPGIEASTLDFSPYRPFAIPGRPLDQNASRAPPL